ncbi:MAG: right-handed parallel beta-helix repeat-containing protein [Balneolaceae bacterium]|nr:right-handed parallel beta-helix repeat-containing protein [Balneolaceae bacterium]MBO6546488.1 right-handed parallel beta-helix repeat-containing protein [Balneolaceae bacterium]MBO6648847.1 right-handed parallel beta-helix repeat-containing protein [Balneolaceae bacterium]
MFLIKYLSISIFFLITLFGLYKKNSNDVSSYLHQEIKKANVLDHGVIPNDSTVDNADSISAVLAEYNVVYFPSGVYYTNALKNKLKSNQLIYGDGKNASIIQRKDTLNEYLIEQISGSGISNSVNNVTFKDLGIFGIPRHQYSLVKFRDSYNLTFERISFKFAEGREFVDPNADSLVAFPKMALLRFDSFDKNSTNEYTNYILNCDFEKFYYGVWDRVEGNNFGGNLIIRDSKFFNNGRDSTTGGHGSTGINIGSNSHFGSTLNNYKIVNNEFKNIDDTGIMIVGDSTLKKDILISGNTIKTYQVPIWVESNEDRPTTNIQIIDNRTSSEIDVGIQLDDVQQFIIEGNIVDSSGAAGIMVFDSENGIISNNQVISNGKVWKETDSSGTIVNYNDGIRLSSRRNEGTTNVIVSNNVSIDNGFISNPTDTPPNTQIGGQITVSSFSDYVRIEGNLVSNRTLMQPTDTADLSKLIYIPNSESRHLNSTVLNNSPEIMRVNTNYVWRILDLDFTTIKFYKINNYNTYLTIKSLKGARFGDQVTINYKNNSTGTPYGIVWPTNGSIEWIGGTPPTPPSYGNEITVVFECISFEGSNKFKEIYRY